MSVDKKKLLSAALALAARGIPVFPTQDKKPAWSNDDLGLKKGEGGYKTATTDPDRVRFLFGHPRATEIAVPMGAMSGLMCVDVDCYKSPEAAEWAAAQPWLMGTLCHTTRSGGRHFFFKHPGNDIKFPSTLRQHVDIKVSGNGYVCFPPTDGYMVLVQAAPKDFPLDVLKDVMKAKGGTGRVNGNGASDSDEVLIEQVLSASALYPAIRQLAYRLPGRQIDGKPITEAQGVEIINALMLQSVAADSHHDRHEDWTDRLGKVPDLVESAFRKNAPINQDDIDALVGAAAGQKIFFQRPVGPQREVKSKDIREHIQHRVPEEGEDDEVTTINVQDLTAKTLQPIDWLIPQMIPRKSTVSLAGTSNVGKTRWLAGLVVGLAVGDTTRMGLPQCTAPVSTLWFANEERQDDIERRLKAVARQHGDRKSKDIFLRGKDKGMMRLVALNEIGTPEIDEENIAKIVRWAERGNVGLILFDPYVTLSDAIDENSAVSAAVLTKAFLLISELTGAAVLHAHHTPKNSAAKNDWYRGDAGAWRGSGAIYSALDCGFTLSHWRPKKGETATSWDANYLTANLSRWVVLDTGKIREGKALDPVVYEMVGQEMAAQEGDPIGVCRRSNEAEAADSVMLAAVDELAARSLGEALIRALGGGKTTITAAHKKMHGTPGWPDVTRLRDAQRDVLRAQFKDPVVTSCGTVQMIEQPHASNQEKWVFLVALDEGSSTDE